MARTPNPKELHYAIRRLAREFPSKLRACHRRGISCEQRSAFAQAVVNHLRCERALTQSLSQGEPEV